MTNYFYYCWECEATQNAEAILEGEQGEPICPHCHTEINRYEYDICEHENNQEQPEEQPEEQQP